MRDPAEGTILTVVREMAQPHRDRARAHARDRGSAPTRPPSEQDALIAEVLERALEAGQESVERGPELLPVLREAGVVDAGGYGLTVLFAGVIAALRGERAARARRTTRRRASRTRSTSPRRYRYCTNFAVTGSDARAARASSSALEQLGDSVLVVGDATTLKVHVHTDDPERATALFDDAGTVSHLDVADMHAQVEQRASGSPRARNGRRAAVRPPAACSRSSRGDGIRGALREPRRRTARRRADAQPLDLRPARRHPRGPGRGGRRAAQQRRT